MKTFPRLDAAGAAEFLEQGEGVAVDVLPPEHYAARHLPGARQACVYEVNFLDQVAALGLGRDAPILLYGAGPGSLDSVTAAEKLDRAGYSDLSVFPGGLEEWLAAGRALVGEYPEAVEPPHPELVLERRSYKLVPEASRLNWAGRNNNSLHAGILPVSSGALDARDETATGRVVMDMTGLRNLDLEGDELKPVLESHLRSDDFFFTALFPKAVFEIKAVDHIPNAPATMPNVMVTGALSLRGISRHMQFPAHLRNVDQARLALVAHLDFDRTGWGVIYGSARFFQCLGYHVVHDEISVDFRLVFD